MSAVSVDNPYPIFLNIDGSPLENGYIWVGAPNADPQTNPINVYWDKELTIAAAQPIRTINGYPSRSGSPSRFYAEQDFSITVTNKNGSLVYSATAMTQVFPAFALTYKSNIDNSVQRTTEEKLNDTISIKDFGAIGDGITDDSAALHNAAASGRSIYFPPGTYKGSPLVFAENTKFLGESPETVTLDIPTLNTQITIWIKNSGCSIENINVKVNMSASGSGGTNGTICTVGLGTAIQSPQTLVKNTIIRNVTGTNYGLACNAFTVIGNVEDITIENVMGDGFAQGIVCHWGSNRNPDLSFIEQYYPHDIRLLNNQFFNLDSYGVFITGCYNVKLSNLFLQSCGSVVAVVPGDGIGDAGTASTKILNNIAISHIYAENITNANAIFFDGEGLEPISGEYGRADYRNVHMSDVCIRASNVIAASVAKIEDASNLSIDNLYIDSPNVAATGLEVRRSSNISVKNYSTNAAKGVYVDRSKNITIDASNIKNNSGSTTTNGIEVIGSKYSTTLASALNASDTTIVLSGSFPIRAYPGDKIRISGTTSFVVVSSYAVNGDTTINILPSTVSALIGASVYLDARVDNFLCNECVVDGYNYNITDINTSSDTITNISVKNSKFVNAITSNISFTRANNRNISGNVDLNGSPIILSWTPAFNGVSVTTTSAIGRYYVQNGICYFDADIDYNSLDTADASAIRFDGIPITPKNLGSGLIKLNTYLSTGFNFAATDTISPQFWNANNGIVFADNSGSLFAYNSGKIDASGKIMFSGFYFV